MLGGGIEGNANFEISATPSALRKLRLSSIMNNRHHSGISFILRCLSDGSLVGWFARCCMNGVESFSVTVSKFSIDSPDHTFWK
jgi:hypothetical protein